MTRWRDHIRQSIQEGFPWSFDIWTKIWMMRNIRVKAFKEEEVSSAKDLRLQESWMPSLARFLEPPTCLLLGHPLPNAVSWLLRLRNPVSAHKNDHHLSGIYRPHQYCILHLWRLAEAEAVKASQDLQQYHCWPYCLICHHPYLRTHGIYYSS